VTTLLITGIAGFIGSNLARSALDHGYEVRGLDDFSSGTEANLAPFRREISLFQANLSETSTLRRACEGADCVLHYAAIASVPKSMSNPMQNHESNATGTLNLLLAARDAGVRRVVFASSSSVYGNQESLPIHETRPLDPLSPYAVSKLTGELYMRILSRLFGVETVCFRYFNVFGPNQDPDSPYSGVLACFIQQMLSGERPTIYGDGEQTRDFTYVENVVDANLLAIRAPVDQVDGRVFNLATGRQASLNEVYAILQQLTGYRQPPAYAAVRQADIRHSVADISAVRDALGFRPTVNLEEGLRKTVDWYRKAIHASPRIAETISLPASSVPA
jgi:nucleoside-diphosphate-sugar epimerase